MWEDAIAHWYLLNVVLWVSADLNYIISLYLLYLGRFKSAAHENDAAVHGPIETLF